MPFPAQLQQFDYHLFSKINGQWHNDFFDVFFLLIREGGIWIPFYFFLLLFITINFKRKGWWWSGTLALTAIISNYISSNLIKDHVMRLRPCRDPNLADTVRDLANYCPSSSSFTSSHATNHFTVAMFLFITLRKVTGNRTAFIFVWAGLISYAQVYVGVHFPIDVVCGAIAGTIIGYLAGVIFNQKFGLCLPAYQYNYD